jgi:enamine deaminase RidA (YjgF/YER057c/UK114 family)
VAIEFRRADSDMTRLPVLAPELIKRALAAHGGTLADVVKQVVYVTDIRYQAPVSNVAGRPTPMGQSR